MQPELTSYKHFLLETDATDKAIFVHFVNVAREHGEGWVDYMWPKPEKNHLPRRSLIFIKFPQKIFS
jgi:methyl-accepting chemotaxis protein